MKRLGKEKAHDAMTPKTRESVKRKEEVIKKLRKMIGTRQKIEKG
jgi:hypothetical protein